MSDTTGICITFDDDSFSDYRLFFFELDGMLSEISQDVETVIRLYIKNHLDVLVHRTKKGFHFISPTVITKRTWKHMMDEVRHLNPKCPMTTLRWKPNKYPNEDGVWYIAKAHYAVPRSRRNSLELCNLLNHCFKSEFRGEIKAQPKMVTYQLPEASN